MVILLSSVVVVIPRDRSERSIKNNLPKVVPNVPGAEPHRQKCNIKSMHVDTFNADLSSAKMLEPRLPQTHVLGFQESERWGVYVSVRRFSSCLALGCICWPVFLDVSIFPRRGTGSTTQLAGTATLPARETEIQACGDSHWSWRCWQSSPSAFRPFFDSSGDVGRCSLLEDFQFVCVYCCVSCCLTGALSQARRAQFLSRCCHGAGCQNPQKQEMNDFVCCHNLAL